ncbi:MAG: hypothetical protein Q8R25_04555 [bacterium]|nr:hypothetical protein [bacterium]
MRTTLLAALLFTGFLNGANAVPSSSYTPPLRDGEAIGSGGAYYRLFHTKTIGECLKAVMAFGMEHEFSMVSATPADENTQSFADGCVGKFEGQEPRK